MPTTSPPNYVESLARPQWTPSADPTSRNALGTPLVRSNVDVIRASHINNIRLIIDLIYSHTHDFNDSIGSC